MAVSFPSGSDMDQHTAQVLFNQGATLVFLDVPEGTEFGIDYNSWTTGPNFRGVKMIPPGIHYVFYSAVNSDNQPAPRTGFFYNFDEKEILIKKWDKKIEDIKPVSGAEEECIMQQKQELDRYLAPYPYESYKKWVSLTSFLTKSLVQKLQPLNEGKINSVAQFESLSSNTQQRKDKANEMEGDPPVSCDSDDDPRLPQMKKIEGSEIRFSEIPKQKHPKNATPAEITKCNLDHSYVLNQLIEMHYKEEPTLLLGEMQFAFICFLVGQVYDAFEQWKKLVHLLCSCDEALGVHPNLFSQFINILHYQVKEIPEDFFVDIVSTNNFLTHTLQMFFSNLDSNEVDKALREKGLRFQDHLQKKFRWDFTTDPDDDEPIVVDL